MIIRRIGALVLALVLVLTVGILPAAAAMADTGELMPLADRVVATGTINVNESLNVRSGPGTGYSKVGTIAAGTLVQIYEFRTVSGVEWGRIDMGWISMAYVILGDNPIASGTINVQTTMNVRSGPGTGYSKVGTIAAGTHVDIYEIRTVSSTDWGRIDMGWISMDYVILDADAPEVPDVPEVPEYGTSVSSGDWSSNTYVDDVTWTFYSSGTLVISGTGEMMDCELIYVDDDNNEKWLRGWEDHKSEILAVVVEEGITYVGAEAFSGARNLKTAIVADSVTEIGYRAFRDCDSLTAVSLGDGLEKTGIELFEDCDGLVSFTFPNHPVDYGNDMFLRCDKLKNITFPEKMTTISEGMFSECLAMTAMVIPDTITTIEGTAFENCRNLANITIPDSVTVIGEGVFRDCDALTEVVLPDSVTEVEHTLFQYCDNLVSVTLPAAATRIGSSVFAECTALTHVTVPGNVSLMEHTFNDAVGLKTVKFLGHAPACYNNLFGNITVTAYYPSNFASWTEDVRQQYGGTVTWVAYESAFEPGDVRASGTCGENVTWTLTNAGKLIIAGTGPMENYITETPWTPYADLITEAEIQRGVTVIGSGVFYGMEKLEKIYIADTVTRILNNAFFRCYALKAVDIPDSVTFIGNSAFMDCTALESLSMGNGVTALDSYAFKNCTALSDVQFSNVLTDIGQEAFYATGLGEVILPDCLTTIGKSAFCGSTMTSVTIPGGVTSLGASAFSSTKLTSVTMDEGITEIPAFAFTSTPLVSISIPSSVRSIGSAAFKNCADLETVYFAGYEAPSFASNTFTGVTATAYYPDCDGWTADDLQNYGGTITWEAYAPDSFGGVCGDDLTWLLYNGTLTISGRGDMYDYAGMNDTPWSAFRGEIAGVSMGIALDDNITSIGDHAFDGCFNLCAADIPETVTSIGTAAFRETQLMSMTIPHSVASIGTDAFAFCGNLQELTIKHGVTSIGTRAFAECGSLTAVEIPDTVTSIGNRAFYDCAKLESVTLPAELPAIGDETFTGCAALTQITVPAGVTSVGSGAFTDSGLESIVFMGNAPAIAADAFTRVTAEAFYPRGNATWTADVMQNYGGALTWATHEIGYIPDVTYSSVSVSLEGDIGLNYYVKLSDRIALDETAYMQFTYDDQVQTVPMSQAIQGSDGTYRFSCAIPAKRMTDVVTGQMYTADGPVGDPKEYSVARYCVSMKEHVENNNLTGYDSLLALLDAMLNYGGYSQLSFGYNTGDLANASLSEAEKALPENLDASVYAHSVSGSEEGIAVYSASLLLESRTTIRFYFTLTGDRWIDDFGFTVDGKDARLTQTGSLYYIDVPNVAAKDLDVMHTVVSDGGLTVSYCGLSYVNQILNWSGASEADVNTAKALYLYNQAANAYFGE